SGQKPLSSDFKTIEAQARKVTEFVQQVREVVPHEKWTRELTEEVSKIAFKNGSWHDLYVEPHDIKCRR
ncbi:unnamed protein product, partial [Pylaiella littoralis]